MNKSVCFDLPNMTQSQTPDATSRGEQAVPSTIEVTIRFIISS